MKSAKIRKILLWITVFILCAGLVYATADLLGQTNKKAADAGISSVDMEMATLESIKKPANESNINWAEINPLDKKLKGLDAQYQAVAKTAGEEKAIGSVSAATHDKGMQIAKDYNETAIALADAYEKNNCITRAKTVRQLGVTRLANADMIFNELDSDRIDAYSEEQEKLREAQKAYLDEGDLSPADKAELKKEMLPRLQAMSEDLVAQASGIGEILSEVSSQATSSMSLSGLGGCAAKTVTSENPTDDVSSLLSPLNSLLALVENMGSNVQGMISDLSAF